MSQPYYVRAVWDEEAKIFYSQTNVPGLVIETETMPEFAIAVEELVPVMLAANTETGPGRLRPVISAEFDIAVWWRPILTTEQLKSCS